MSVQKEQPTIRDELAVRALIDMASRRGLHASEQEAEQAWKKVVVSREVERLATAWRRLFSGHSVAPSPYHLMSDSQLPAWVISEGCVGILLKVASADEPERIEWIGGISPEEGAEFDIAWVPVAPLPDAEESFLPEKERGPATQAIVEGLKAHSGLFYRVAVASVFMNIIAILASLFVMQVYDRVVPNFAYETLWFLAAGLFLGYVIDVVLKIVRLKLLDESSRQLDEGLSLFIFDRLLGLDFFLLNHTLCIHSLLLFQV